MRNDIVSRECTVGYKFGAPYSCYSLVAKSNYTILHICPISLRCDPCWLISGENEVSGLISVSE